MLTTYVCFARDVRTVFVKPGYRSEGFCSCKDNYDSVLIVLGAWWTEQFLVGELKSFSFQRFQAQKKLLNSFELAIEESDGNESLRAGKVPLLFRCFMYQENKSKELAYWR